jgi:hypothetical protein
MICCILVIGFVLIIGLFDFGYSPTKIVKSFINFFLRTWALLALFPLAGCLKVRPQIIFRAVCILCLQCLILTIISYGAHFAGIALPQYTSTLLAKIGGIGEGYYEVSLFFLEQGEKFRLTLFAPWAPALAFAGNIFFFLAKEESNKFWRFAGMSSSALLVWGSASRLGLLCLISLPFIIFVLSNLARPSMQFTAAVGSFISGLFGYRIISGLQDLKAYLDNLRASSTRVREDLASMALYYWRTDAPIWGHGLKPSRGPEVVNFMPLGSHHTWLGLLYVHGIVGLIAFIIPIVYSFVELTIKSQNSKIARTGLTMLLILLIFSIGENLETLAYIYWPGLVMLGIALKESPSNEKGVVKYYSENSLNSSHPL